MTFCVNSIVSDNWTIPDFRNIKANPKIPPAGYSLCSAEF